MNLSGLAFLLGFAGSLHCAVMCGPILLGLPFHKTSTTIALLQLGLYQLGRIMVYGIFGLLAGAAGEQFATMTGQTTLSYCIGGLLIGIFLLHFVRFNKVEASPLQQWFIRPMGNFIARFFGTPYYAVLAGMLNGLIPCGMVYLALSTSLGSGGAVNGAVFMLAFGAGTVPLLLFIALGGNFIRKHLRFNTLKMLPYAALLMGVLFVLRGMQLDIPFLSPVIKSAAKEVTVCK